MGSRKIARSRRGRGSAQNFAAVLMEATVSFFGGNRLLLFRFFLPDVIFPDLLPPEGAPLGSERLLKVRA